MIDNRKPSRTVLAAARLGLTLACLAGANAPDAGAQTGAKTAAPAAKPAPPATTARDAINRIIEDQYAAMAAGDVKAWGNHLDPQVFVFGSAPDEALLGATAVIAEMTKDMGPAADAQLKYQVQSRDLTVAVAPGADAGWAAGRVDVTVSGHDGKNTAPFRMTEVFVKTTGGWRIVAAHWSRGLDLQTAVLIGADGKLPALKPVPGAAGKGAEALPPLVQKLLRSGTALAAALHPGDGTLLIGSSPGEFITGGTRLRSAITAQAEKHATTYRATSAMRAQLAGKNLAWVAGNIEMSASLDGRGIVQPYRSLMVLLREAGAWRLVHWHFSNGIPDDM